MVEDSKDGIISDVRRSMAKRKSILAKRDASYDVFNIRRRVQSRRNFPSLLSSISSTPEAITMIPDDDTQQFEVNQGAYMQPIIIVQFSSQSNPSFLHPGALWGFI